MLCLVCELFIISTSAIDCLGKFVSEMTYCVSSGTLTLLNLDLTFCIAFCDDLFAFSSVRLVSSGRVGPVPWNLIWTRLVGDIVAVICLVGSGPLWSVSV